MVSDVFKREETNFRLPFRDMLQWIAVLRRSRDGDEGIVGRTLVIHAGEDDFMGASGNAGSRVACGIVELVEATEALDMLPDNLKAKL